MARRVELVEEMAELEAELVAAFAQPRGNRTWAECKRLLGEWRQICAAMYEVGYRPPPLPIDLHETKVM